MADPYDPTAPLPVPGLQAPQPPQPAGVKDYAPLLAILPIAMAKGGQPAVAALLSAFSQARQQRAQQGRQNVLDQNAVSQQQWQRQYQQGQLDNDRLQRQQAFKDQFARALPGVDSAEGVNALLDFYGPQADALGLKRQDLSNLALQTQTPNVLLKRKVLKAWGDLPADSKNVAMKTQASLQADGQTIPFAQWAPLIGGVVDPQTGAFPQVPAKPDVPNTPEEQFYQRYATERGAKAFGELPTTEQAKARELWSGAGRQPQDHGLRDIQKSIAELRLQQLQQSGLPPRVQSAVTSQAKGFDALPVVKRVQTQAEAVQFVKDLDPNTKNPADDQALIYAFAKAMDPDSVVREGEYATVQKYSQSWIDSFGFNAARVLSNSEFLTPQSRANLKKTILARYQPTKKQYDNVRRSYAQKIDHLTGQKDGESYLTDYAGGFPSDTQAPAAPAGGQPTGPKVGEQRMINGRLGEWDGKGWVAK